MKKKSFILLMAFMAFSFEAKAWTACGTDNTGKTANCEYEIDDKGTLTIRPVGDNGNIGSWDQDTGTLAPWRGKGVKNVVIEEGIKDLGNYAFRSIKSENPIKIPNSVTDIGTCAFYGVNTSEVIIPNTVTSIGYQAFNWSSIQKIDIPDSVQTIGGAFRGTNLQELVIPDSVQSIGYIALSHCTKLQTLVISDQTDLGKIFSFYDEEMRVDLDNLKIYCMGDTAQCNANLAAAGYTNLSTIPTTTKKVNGMTYVYDNKGNLMTTYGNRLNKRIYTVEEANMVSGKKNKVMIRYK
ncbi:MAG: leucine-rich repeat domain-containing protein [Alphaproteobacteria bacterium]|nr:leucine-rich repeat domain-containing protein [Alphaproteobacteria bacterium]